MVRANVMDLVSSIADGEGGLLGVHVRTCDNEKMAIRIVVDMLKAANIGEAGTDQFWRMTTIDDSPATDVQPPPYGGTACTNCGRDVFGGIGALLPADHVCGPKDE
jgi:hypothetical protein